MEAFLNRSVMIIVPKKPFYDWINYLDPEHPIHDLKDHNSMLLPDEYTYQNAIDFINDNYELIFEDHLHGMWIEEDDWPQKRTFTVFNEWFSWHFSSLILDTVENAPIYAKSIDVGF